VTKNPEFLQDIWDLDSRVFQLLLGVDALPLPKYRSAREPRDRLLRAVTEHHQALFDKLCNSKKAEQYGDLSDVSDIFKTRLKDWTSAGITIASCASANTALLWAANVNSAPVAFWLVWYVFQHEDLLEGIRREIRDYIRCEQTEDGSQLQFDVPALLNDCRLLNATYLETLRLEAHTFSFKVAKEDCHHRGSSRSDLLKSTATLCAEEGGFCLCSAFF
jgi:cytochrome P450